MLLDSGATHILRQPVSEEEWEKAIEIVAQTATGECLLRQSANGSPLTRDSVTPIIPLGENVGIGGKITWLTNKCSLSHPDLGSIAVKLQPARTCRRRRARRSSSCLKSERHRSSRSWLAWLMVRRQLRGIATSLSWTICGESVRMRRWSRSHRWPSDIDMKDLL